MIDYRKIFKEYDKGIIGPDKTFISSVVLPVVEIEGRDSIVFQLRSKNLKNQPGEVSLPGGRVDNGETPKEAAIREFCEELESNSNDLDIITELDSYITPTKGIIHCYLGICKNLDLNIKNDEVEELFTVPIDFFKKNEPDIYYNTIKITPSSDFPFDEMNISREYFWGSLKNQVLFYKYGKYIIWGITAQIVRNFVNKLSSMV